MVESYVVQIYRRDATDRQRLAGTVERVGQGERQHFASAEELWRFLAAERAPRRGRRKPQDPGACP
jgi:hypothetical protein